MEDILGRVPIHYICCNGADPDVIDHLLSPDPATATIADRAGWLPLHVACQMGVSTESMQKLLSANPSAVTAKTAKGSTPLSLISRIDCKNKGELVSLLENLPMEQSHNNRHVSFVVSRAA
mmetsp:Transcript_19600/g.28895  ORF Transcript_19600/g.28895 Transcript_19600/m.28895 type:complete len:121 (-) Transcript_19600:67-429(-)